MAGPPYRLGKVLIYFTVSEKLLTLKISTKSEANRPTDNSGDGAGVHTEVFVSTRQRSGSQTVHEIHYTGLFISP